MPKQASLRMVWLEAFVAVADEGTQGSAAKELGLDQPTVSRYVGGLEGWLRKALLDPAIPGQLTDDGSEFLITAIEVLVTLSQARGVKSDGFGELRFEWLEAFNAFATNEKQAAAAAELHVEQPVVSRHLRKLRDWLGQDDLVDRKMPRRLSPVGARFLPVAQEVLKLLNGARAPLAAEAPLDWSGPATPTKFIKIPGRRDGP